MTGDPFFDDPDDPGTSWALSRKAARYAHPIFVSEGWVYGHGDSTYTPTQAELVKTVDGLIEMLDRDHRLLTVESNRFKVWKNDVGAIFVSLVLGDL